MRRAPARGRPGVPAALRAGWGLGLVAVVGVGFWAGHAQAQGGRPSSGLTTEGPGSVIADALSSEPPALRELLEQASALEAAADSRGPGWPVAVLYCQAARGGSAEAQYRLGMLYAFGQGVPQNRAHAASLFSLAASLGHQRAGRMLESIELSSAALPDCVEHDLPPERPPEVEPEGGPRGGRGAGSPPHIDQLVQALPRSRRWVLPLVTTMSAWYALDPRLVLSVIAVESNFEQGARSQKAAMGLMQLIPATAERFNVRDAFDASQNLRGGMRYLRWLLSYYRGNVSYALAAYNAGEGRVDRYRGVPPFAETRAYVTKVVGLYGALQHAFDETLTPASPALGSGAR